MNFPHDKEDLHDTLCAKGVENKGKPLPEGKNHGNLFIAYARNKEDIEVLKVPLSEIERLKNFTMEDGI